MKVYETTKELAEEALISLIESGQERAKGKELLEWIEHNRADQVPLIEKSWGSNLTKASNDPTSRLMREPGKYGYILREGHEAPPDDEGVDPPTQVTPPPPTPEEVPRIFREQKLYSLLVEWLLAKDFAAADTSSTKRGGAWGNPDVVGIRIEETIGGASHLELTTIEAKVSDRDWRRVFFEAVSHKRFADRVYFAFSYPSSDPAVSQLPEFNELREYAEKYRVGILVVFMEPEKHSELLTSPKATELNLSLEDVLVEEVWPAIHDPVSPFTRDRFLRDVLDIHTLKDLHVFGE